jgi:hypothetical protein
MKTSISEFERTKPVITLSKINELSKRIEEERIKTEILYKDRVNSLIEIDLLIKDLKKTFLRGE